MTSQLLRRHSKHAHHRLEALYLVLGSVCVVIIALVPFHALLTTWAGSTWGYIDGWRIWKEVLLLAMLPLAIVAVSRDHRLRQWLRSAVLARLILAYAVLYLASGVMAYIQGNVNLPALLYAYGANLRFLALFLLVIATVRRVPWLRRSMLQVVLVGGALVVVFGLMQIAVLPFDVLRHVGYGPDTIPAYQTVDNKLAYQRIQSTLRGANPLGAYMVVYLALLAAYVRRFARHWWYWVLVAGSVAVLFFSYSRSGYIGVLIALLVIGWVELPRRWRKWAVAGTGVALIAAILAVVLFRNAPTVQNTLFHSDDSSASVTSSNESRANAMRLGLQDVWHEPLGRGPGTAGPASARNLYPARFAENYLLQIGQEVGWVGIVLFGSILWLVGVGLWRLRRDPLALALLGSFVGLFVVNLVSHAWTDDTLGLLWWGLAGLVAGPALGAFRLNSNNG